MPQPEVSRGGLQSLHPLSAAQRQGLAASIQGLDIDQLCWASGYMSGFGAGAARALAMRTARPEKPAVS